MNLACVTHAYPRWDGDVAGAFVERLMLGLVNRGHAVHVIAPADEGRGGKELRHRVPVTRVRYAPARWETLAYRGTMVAAARTPWGMYAAMSLIVQLARALARLCREGNVDLVHAHWWVPGGMSAWLARRPYVVTLHGTDVALLDRFTPARWAARPVLRGAALVTAVSSYLATRAARAAALDESVVVQPMPVDAQAFTRTSAGGGGVVTVGRLSPQKRVDLILEAVGLLKQRGRMLPLTIVGDGQERAALERRAAELGIAAETRFLGEVPPPRIPEAVGNADVFAFPAAGEGFGLAAAEALMLGVPVVAATDGGGATDIVPARGPGRRVAPGNAGELADAIDELAHDPASRRLAAEAGAALRRRLEPAAVAERFEALYRRALKSALGRA
ncbi:MAG TPA: glycosyltransferase [Gemmatimonadales bacterium]|nr:glycosyltransferase [Gemmatimonadales bacterium]